MRKSSYHLTILVLFILSLVVGPAMAQKQISRSDDVVVYTSKSTKRKKGQTIDGFEKVERDSYTIRLWSKKDGYEYVNYDDELNIVGTETETEEDEDEDEQEKDSDERSKDELPSEAFTFTFADKKYRFKGIVDDKKKLNVFTLTEIDEDGDELSTSEIGRIEGDDFYKRVSNCYMTQRLSEDESKLLLYYKLAERRDSENRKVLRFRLMVFNQEMESVMDRVVEFEDKKGRVLVGGEGWLTSTDRSAFRLKNDGSVYAWASVDKGRRYKKEERFDLLVYRIEDGDMARTRVEDVNTDYWVCSFIENEFVMLSTWGYAGYKFLGMWGPDPGQEGFFLARWNGEEGVKPIFSRIKFGADHLAKNHPKNYGNKLRKKEAKGKPVLAPYYVIDEARVLEDGTLLILGQERYTVTVQRKYSSYTRYYYNDIHGFNITLDGDVNWSYVIPKAQMTGGYGFGGGYVTKKLGDKIYTIFNDNFRNHEKDWSPYKKKPYRFSGLDNPVALVTFDVGSPDAKQDRQLLWKSKSAGGLFDPEKFFSRYDEDYGLLYIQAGKLKQRLLRLEFN